MKKKLLYVLIAVCCISFTLPIYADDTVDRIEEISKEIVEHEQRISELRKELNEITGHSGTEVGEVIYSDKNVDVIYDGLNDGYIGLEINLKVKNKSDCMIEFKAGETSINDIMVDTFCSKNVFHKMKSKVSIQILGDENDILAKDVYSIKTSFCYTIDDEKICTDVVDIM